MNCPKCNGTNISADVAMGNIGFKQRGGQWEFDEENFEIESYLSSQLPKHTYMVCNTCYSEWYYSPGEPLSISWISND